IYGTAMGASVPSSSQELAKGLGKTRVFMNGIESFLTYASANQINALVPAGVLGGGQAVLHIESEGILSNSVILPVADAVPGVFTLSGTGLGPAVAVNQDGSINSSANPASRGSIVAFFATGQGQTSPPIVDGVHPPAGVFPRPIGLVSVTIGGIRVPPEGFLRGQFWSMEPP